MKLAYLKGDYMGCISYRQAPNGVRGPGHSTKTHKNDSRKHASKQDYGSSLVLIRNH